MRATRCHSVPLSDVFQRALVKWLYRNKEGRAASWFEKYWTGERGNWTRGHAGVAGTNNNNGLESRWKRFKTAVCGGSGSCASLSPGVVIAAANRYLCELSKEEASRLRHDTAKRHAVNKYTFQALPWPIREDWNHIEELHPLTLQLSYVQGTKQAKEKWRKAMKQLREAPGYERLLPVHQKIRLVTDLSLPARNDLTSIILPSAKLLDSFDPDRRMSTMELRDAIVHQRNEFDEMVQYPIQYETDRPGHPLEEILDTYESFYFLEPIGIKWGRWGVTKCSCEDFMGAACCGHSTLMAMLFDNTLEFPAMESSKEIAKRAGNSKRPNAWAPENEDTEELGGAKAMKLCPVTACDDMDLLEVQFSFNALGTDKALT